MMNMKSYFTFKEYHPLAAMLIFDGVASIVAFAFAYLIHLVTSMSFGTAVVMEGLLFLVIAQSSVMGNNKLKQESYLVYREFKADDSHNAAYFVALKYGLVGAILLGSTWFIY